MLEMERVHRGEANFDDSSTQAEVARALNFSFASNVVLLIGRVAIATIAGSLSLIIATIDAVLDVMSSTLMWFAAREAKRPNKYIYPVGKHRLESLGVVIFSSVMGTAAFSVIVEGIKQLVAGEPPSSSSTGGGGLPHEWLVVGGTIFVVAMKLVMYLYCRGSSSVSVAAFATDHLNDVVVNVFSLAGALLGAKVVWWSDPAIAILISLWVIYSWGAQGLEQIVTLIGVSASPAVLQKLTYLALHHCPDVVKQIDTVRAYTSGVGIIAEVDIVLPEEMPLREAHNVGEELQIKLESLPGITRAFVHLDVDSSHRPEHI